MADHEHDSHNTPYFAVFIVLCICTAISAAADYIDLKNHVIVIVIVMSVACAKALFVMLYFMHLKFEGNWKFVLLAPTVILAIGLPLALLPDIGVHYYTDVAPQKLEPTLEGHAAGHSEHDAPARAEH